MMMTREQPNPEVTPGETPDDEANANPLSLSGLREMTAGLVLAVTPCFIVVNILALAFSMAALLGIYLESFTPLLTAVLTALFAAPGFWIWRQHLTLPGGIKLAPVVLFVLLLLAGVFIRYPTSTYIHGGWDQGTYYNIVLYSQMSLEWHDHRAGRWAVVLSSTFENSRN